MCNLSHPSTTYHVYILLRKSLITKSFTISLKPYLLLPLGFTFLLWPPGIFSPCFLDVPFSLTTQILSMFKFIWNTAYSLKFPLFILVLHDHFSFPLSWQHILTVLWCLFYFIFVTSGAKALFSVTCVCIYPLQHLTHLLILIILPNYSTKNIFSQTIKLVMT